MSRKSENSSPGRPHRLRYELRRNKKKTAVLAGLFVTALVLVGRLVFTKSPTSEVPVRASAVMAPPPTVVPATGRVPARPGASGASPAAKVEFQRDIFLPNPHYFPEAAKAPDGTKAPVSARESERRILKEAEALRLTSTIMGAVPCVTINGQILGLKDKIEGFEVVAISHWSCDLVKEGIRARIDMEK
jgi:hypothetical protein